MKKFNKKEKEEIKSLEQEKRKEEQFWAGYSNKIKEQIRTENIIEELENFKRQKKKENKNIFKRFCQILGF
jgi:hypothetical protein